MYKFKEYSDDEFFNCKLRGANNVISAVFGGTTDEGGHYANIPPSADHQKPLSYPAGAAASTHRICKHR